jgi:UDP-glucose:(heptosyl)LPS alpha-1,3-glucosyltransferase
LSYNPAVSIKVAIVIERANIALGGAERSVFELMMALRTLGVEVEVLAAKGQSSHRRTRNIHLLCQNTSGKRTGYFTYARALKKHIAENDYSLIHSVLPFDFADIYQPRGGSFAEAVVRNAASYQNTFAGVYKRATAFANYRRTILLQAEKKLCRKQDGPIVAALSEYVAAQFRKHYGLDDERIVITRNGVKANKKVDPAEADKLRSQILSQLGIKEADNPVLFLFVANNFRLKGLAFLIRAMGSESVRKAGRRAYLVVAGNDKAQKYRRLARTLGVCERVLFLGPVRHIQNALSITDVAVLPTFYDPSSRFVLEAMAADKPVITTRFNGASELFVHDRHGKIIDDPRDVRSLAEAIAYFTNTENIEKASEFISEDNVKEKVSITGAAEQLRSLYEAILERRR